MERVPALLRDADDREVAELALVENIQRKDLGPLEKAISFQAYLENGPLNGIADFLVRAPGRSELGDFHYQAWDAKLAHRSKPYFLIQLCAYAEMLEEAQDRLPGHVGVVLGAAGGGLVLQEVMAADDVDRLVAIARHHPILPGVRELDPVDLSQDVDPVGLHAHLKHDSRRAEIRLGQVADRCSEGASPASDRASTSRSSTSAVMASISSMTLS